MPKIVFRDTGETIEGAEAVKEFLAQYGVTYEKWGVDRLPENLRTNYDLTPEEQQQIIDAYREELERLKKEKGYITEDIVVLSEKTPNLDDLMAKFKREHHHTDDEVRFVVDGSGIFPVKIEGRVVEIHVGPGDLIVVPAGARHWFELDENKKIKCIRVFKTPAGWEAIYNENEKATMND
ncbi:MAG TPA: cupin domain-containing protein [Persephonella sp.]|uniref:Acireductone dioxygenase n=1 Tax=Persephonella marina (strain DSM 14350 / EX-H1) TaxID=123214 RepID=C0QSI9_PERMH|nr:MULTISPECIES: cupin domain-containing protein [Persephonella]ACO04787.1 1,2-dihydroxy-3-keto-5-methylthiopentene dioxygenase (5-methylthio-3-oxo-1-penten-1,2-diol dioxygenase) (DHK-MTPenedioxygenase) [Persephonella marina EX-H1]HCB69381.1 cupin domain-containing protein [Persephonella sp.]